MRELTALNHMFQQQMSQSSKTNEQYRRDLEELQEILREITYMAARGQSRKLPDLTEFSNLEPGQDVETSA